MKLPEDSKKRNQILVLAGLGGILVLTLVYFGLSSLLSTRAESRLRLKSATEQLDTIDREIKALPDLRQTRDDLFWRIQFAATNHILFHEYRNYHLTARETLLPLAAELGLAIDIPKEGVVTDFPILESKAANRAAAALPASPPNPKAYPGPISTFFALYSVTLTGRAGFDPLLAFVRRIETMNPYLTVSELTVSADPKTPEEHAFSLTLLWPIWKNLEQKPKVEDLILPAKEYDAHSEIH